MVKSNQEVYSAARKHLLTQLKHSKVATRCLLRGPDNLKCALGIFIPDDEYTESLEDGPVHDSNFNSYWYFSERGYDILLLKDLQQIHDMYEVEDWKEQLDLLAQDFNLKVED